MKLDREFLQENGFLDDNTGKISLADKLEGKTKQYIKMTEVGTKSGVLYYIEEGVVKSEVVDYLLEQEVAFMEEINQAGMELITKEFIMELKERYNIKKEK
jgi:hypothetical protein